MDPVQIEKLQAMKGYRRKGLILTLMQYCLSFVCFGLFLSSPLWIPKLHAAVKYFFFVAVPNMGTYLFCPKCFFLLGNAIVVFLVGESKLSGTAPSLDIYDEYMERSKSSRNAPGTDRKETAAGMERPVSEENIRRTSHGIKEEVWGVQEEEEEEREEEEKEDEDEDDDDDDDDGGDGWDEEGGGEECLHGDEYNGLPADELNRRIEDFIARVNKQRRLEAATLLACGG